MPTLAAVTAQEINDLAEALVGLIGPLFPCRMSEHGTAWQGPPSKPGTAADPAGTLPVLGAALGSLVDADLDRETVRLQALSAGQSALPRLARLSSHPPRAVISLLK